MVHSLKKYDGFKMAAACLFLAGKVEETPKKLKDVISFSWMLDPRRKKEQVDAGLAEQSSEFWDYKVRCVCFCFVFSNCSR